jgi:hypothetical protein
MSVHSSRHCQKLTIPSGRREIKHMTQASLVALLEIDPPADTMIPANPINTETVEDPCEVVRDADQFRMRGQTMALSYPTETILENL